MGANSPTFLLSLLVLTVSLIPCSAKFQFTLYITANVLVVDGLPVNFVFSYIYQLGLSKETEVLD